MKGANQLVEREKYQLFLNQWIVSMRYTFLISYYNANNQAEQFTQKSQRLRQNVQNKFNVSKPDFKISSVDLFSEGFVI